MAVKSIIEVEIDRDGSFAKFKKSFEEYRKQVSEMPGAWGEVTEATAATKGVLDGIAALMMAHSEHTRRIVSNEREQTSTVERTERSWSGIAKYTKETANNVLSATTSLLRWSAISGVLTGVVGGGGLYGLDRLALGVGAGRRASQGLGIGYGDRRSFEVNLQRLVNPDQFLSGVNESLTDYSQRQRLYGAGLGERDLAGKDTGQVAVEALRGIKHLADQTPTEQLAQLIQSRQLGGLVTVEDLRRLKATSGSEFESILGRYNQDRGPLGLTDENQRVWQDLGVRFEESWGKIENSFVKGLTGLAKPIDDLSDSFSKAVTAFLANPHLKDWLDQFGRGIETVVRYIGTDEFQTDIQKFSDAVKAIGSAASSLADWLIGGGKGSLNGPDPAEVNQAWKTPIIDVPDNRSFLDRALTPLNRMGPRTTEKLLGVPLNNPFNIRDPHTGGFAHFANSDDAVRRTAWQLQRDEYKHGLTTLRSLIGDENWGHAPASDGNDVESYVKDLSKSTGIDPDAELNLKDKNQLAAIIAGIAKRESGTSYSSKVVVQILDNTGGNVNTSVSQLPQ